MAMRHLIASKRRSSSSASRNRHNLSLEESSSYFSSNVEATNTSSQIGSSPPVTSESTTNISTTRLNQNPVAMRQRVTSKRGSSSSSHTSNLSSRSTHYLDTEATNSYRQTGSFPSVTSEAEIEKIFGHSLEDLVKAGRVVKPKTAQEFEIAKARDINNMIEMYYHCLFYPAKINNPEITNAWAIAHPDAPEIKELGIDAEMLRFISQLEKVKHVKGMPANLIFENPILFDKKQQRDYMKRLVTTHELGMRVRDVMTMSNAI